MASPYSASPNRRASTNNIGHGNKGREPDSDLSQSLKKLSISTASPSRSPGTPPRPASAFRPPISRSPSVASNRGGPRSPLNGSSSTNGRDSRSATPTLLRKASLNSLHSANGVAPPRRASSVNLMSPSSLRSPLGAMPPDVQEKPPPTAASIAKDHFKAELRHHHGDKSTSTAETLVVVHDNCYGHRYSRPRTSRAALSTIVERPERIKASVLGVSVAYVRLGERHAEGKHAPHPKLDAASIPSIPFRIHKTARRLPLMSQAVTNVHGTKWMEELKMMCDSAEAKLAANGKELQRPDINRGPDHEAPQRLHEGDLYLCAESLDAMEGALGGVCEAVDAVFGPTGPKRAFVAIRPPGHHCSASYPSGFCWVNNVHVGIMHAILSHGLTHAAIIDFDLHHGDGSQTIAWQHNSRGVGLAKNAAWWKKTSIGYFSLHDINSYPCEMGDDEKIRNASICIDNAHGQNIWNVHLEPWKSEAEFWALYESKYSVLLDKTRTFLRAQAEKFKASSQHCKAAIFLSAGFDASEWEGAGMQRHNVNVPTDFYARLTRDVVKIAAEEGTGVEGRIISVLEGGYSDRALYSGILSHLGGLAGEDPVPTKEEDYNGLGFEMGQRIGSMNGRRESLSLKNMGRPYEPAWWGLSELESLEAVMAPPPPEAKEPRHAAPPTYSSPTHSSQAKIAATPKVRRSMSGLSSLSSGSMSRPPSPPPPEVPWTIAAHEMSKLLIPTDRQTTSCKPEDLSAEATRARRDRQSVISPALPPECTTPGGTSAPAGPTRISMRERKQVKPFGSIHEEEEERKNRRRTVGGTTVLATEKATARGSTPNPPGRSKQPGRRLSAASTVVSEAAEIEIPLPGSSKGFTRPTTSQSVRTDSSTSARTTPGAPLAVKKSRTTTATKKDTPKPARVQKRPTTTTTDSANTSQPLAASATASADKGSDGVDQLTSGMKKIKINVITPAQKAARERVKKEEAGQTATANIKRENDTTAFLRKAETMVEPPTAATNAAAATDEEHMFPTTQVPVEQLVEQTPVDLPAGPSTPSYGRVPLLSPLEPRQIPLPASSPVLPSTPTAQPELSAPGSSIFVPYQPEGSTPTALPRNGPLQWMPPNNANTPSPMKRKDLPVFTATSSIPFAGRRPAEVTLAPNPEDVKSELRPVDPVWDVPETPQRQT